MAATDSRTSTGSIPDTGINPAAIRTYLDQLYGTADTGFLAIWTAETKQTVWSPVTDLDGAAHTIAAQAERHNVYTGVGIHPEALGADKRGTADHVSAMPGVFAECDYGRDGHARDDLPPTHEALLDRIMALPLRPSLIVASGHGLHGYWLFPEVWTFDRDTDRERAASMLRRWQALIRRSIPLDPTADLARVLRPAGTINRKPNLPPVPVSLVLTDGPRYTLDDVEQFLPDEEEPTTRPRTDRMGDTDRGENERAFLPRIMANCGWMRHCRDDAATLSEPEWHGALSIAAQCQDGERWAHELSAPYPHYDERETQRKYDDARAADKPRTCASIRRDLDGEPYCKLCAVAGTIKSPIALGYPTITVNGHRAGSHGRTDTGNGGTDSTDNNDSVSFGSAADGHNQAESDEEPWPDRAALPPEHLPVPTLPEQMAPEPFRAWLVDSAELSRLPLDMVAIPAITAAGSVIGRAVGIRPNRYDDFTTVPNHWGAVVARPALMKTDTIGRALRPLGRLAAAAHDAWEQEEADNEIKRERLNAEIAAIKTQMQEVAKKAKKPAKPGDDAKASDAKPGDKLELDQLETELKKKREALREAKTTERRYLTNDATGEKLGELLRDNPRGMLVKRDELSGWLAGLRAQGREQERAFFLEGWNGTGSYTFDRISRGTIHIPALTISMIGGIQPGKLRPLIEAATSESADDDGLLQRFQLIVWPDKLPSWKKLDRYPDKSAAERADAVFTALATSTASTWRAQEDGDGIPYLRFSPAAQTLYDTWRDELEQRVRGDELSASPAFASHLGKYRSLMPALALTFHLIALADPNEHRSPGPVDEAPTRLAAAWCDFLEAHARKLYGAELEPGVAEARALAKKIEAGAIPDGETVRNLYRSQWAGLRTPEQVLAGLNVLVEHGWVRVATVQSGKQGQPKQIVRLHPDLRAATKTGADHDA